MSTVLAVQVIAVHVECSRCGQYGRIQHNHPDEFTRHVLQPLASWWVAHRDPQMTGFEVLANGEHQQWTATNRRSTP